MTNSHNRNGRNAGSGSNTERYFQNHSPQQLSNSPGAASQYSHQYGAGGNGGKRGGGGGGNGANGGGSRGQRSPSTNYFRSINSSSSSNAIPIVQQKQQQQQQQQYQHQHRQPSSSPTGGRMSGGGSRHNNSNNSSSGSSSSNNSFNQRSSPSNGGGFPFSMSSSPLGAGVGGGIGGAPVSGSPPNFSHFAGSKCYDAPAPTALPKPPVHWTTIGSGAGGASKQQHQFLVDGDDDGALGQPE
ncbi:AGAP013026-PA-like protein [Anopheles sinensis]|uniref:AGAP013026-PA-like protein n=1 Tax=Anopheles sinensis TaxID=74873 RepID=A0A084VWM8_ANOSI|nr:AGAP013026-PA-like protein [Anopheles sinensis]